jgi:hypothetical protein
VATGRPTTYSAEIAAQICQRLADGESLRSIYALTLEMQRQEAVAPHTVDADVPEP